MADWAGASRQYPARHRPWLELRSVLPGGARRGSRCNPAQLRETLLCLVNLNRVGDASSKSVAGLAERALGQCTTAFSHPYLLAGCRKRKNRAPNLEVHAAIRVFVFGAPLGKDSISLGDICAISATSPDRKTDARGNRKRSARLCRIHANQSIVSIERNRRTVLSC